MTLRRRAAAALATGLAAATALALAPAPGEASQLHVDRIPHARTVTALTRPPSVSHQKQFKLVFKDDFRKPLNRSYWSVYSKPGTSNQGTSWWTTSHVTRTNAQHGQLHILGYVDRTVAPDGRVVSGGVGLWGRPQRYGKYTMLVRMNSCADVKYAWLLWPANNEWPKDGEIDFAEDEGGNRALTTASLSYAAHNGSRATAKQDYAAPRSKLSGWHLVGVEWTPHSVRYTMDGRYWGATKTKHVPHSPMVFVMQTEGKAAPGHVSLHGQCNADIGWVAQYAYTGR